MALTACATSYPRRDEPGEFQLRFSVAEPLARANADVIAAFRRFHLNIVTVQPNLVEGRPESLNPGANPDVILRAVLLDDTTATRVVLFGEQRTTNASGMETERIGYSSHGPAAKVVSEMWNIAVAVQPNEKLIRAFSR